MLHKRDFLAGIVGTMVPNSVPAKKEKLRNKKEEKKRQ
jgi:hypothetical protein